MDCNLSFPQGHDRFDISLPKSGLWIFGYGSLMWNPGFRHACAEPARLFGYHRRLCLWSIRYRGTPEFPGLVAGLAPGGSCRGVAFRLDDTEQEMALEYLYQREMTGLGYRPAVKNIRLDDRTHVKALAFISRPDHCQYAPRMPIGKIASIIKKASGPMGSNEEYLLNTVDHLGQLGIRDTELHRVASCLQDL